LHDEPVVVAVVAERDGRIGGVEPIDESAGRIIRIGGRDAASVSTNRSLVSRVVAVRRRAAERVEIEGFAAFGKCAARRGPLSAQPSELLKNARRRLGQRYVAGDSFDTLSSRRQWPSRATSAQVMPLFVENATRISWSLPQRKKMAHGA